MIDENQFSQDEFELQNLHNLKSKRMRCTVSNILRFSKAPLLPYFLDPSIVIYKSATFSSFLDPSIHEIVVYPSSLLFARRPQ